MKELRTAFKEQNTRQGIAQMVHVKSTGLSLLLGVAHARETIGTQEVAADPLVFHSVTIPCWLSSPRSGSRRFHR